MQSNSWYWCRSHQEATQRRLQQCALVGPLRSEAEAQKVGDVLIPLARQLRPYQQAIVALLVRHGGLVEDEDGVIRAICAVLKRDFPASPWNMYGRIKRLRDIGLVDFSGRVPNGTITRVWLVKPLEEVQAILDRQ